MRVEAAGLVEETQAGQTAKKTGRSNENIW